MKLEINKKEVLALISIIGKSKTTFDRDKNSLEELKLIDEFLIRNGQIIKTAYDL